MSTIKMRIAQTTNVATTAMKNRLARYLWSVQRKSRPLNENYSVEYLPSP